MYGQSDPRAIDYLDDTCGGVEDSDRVQVNVFCPNGGGHEHIHVIWRAGTTVLFASDQGDTFFGQPWATREEALECLTALADTAQQARAEGEILRMLTGGVI